MNKYIIFAITTLMILVIQSSIIITVFYNLQFNNNNAITDILAETSVNIVNYFNITIKQINYLTARNAAFMNYYGAYITETDYRNLIVENYLLSNSNIEYFFWIPVIAYSELNFYQDFCSNKIKSGCFIKEVNKSKMQNYTSLLNPNITFTQASKRDYYYPITNIIPYLNNRNANILIGYDLNSDNITKNVVDTIKNTNDFSATRRSNLIQSFLNDTISYGVIISFPSFNNSRNGIRNGYAATLVKLGNLFLESIDNLNLSLKLNDIDLFVFDVTADGYVNDYSNNSTLMFKPRKSIYNNIWFETDIVVNRHTVVLNYTLFDRQWRMYFKYSDAYIKSQTSNLLVIMPVILTIIFLFCNIITFILYRFVQSLREKTHLIETKANIASDMLGYVNHEVRNPLNVIKGLVNFTFLKFNDLLKDNIRNSNTITVNDSILLDKIFVETTVSDLSTALGSCNMIEHIVTDILDINKLDSNKLELNNHNVMVGEFFYDIIKSVSQKIDEKQTIVLQSEYDPHLVLYFDPMRMKQILLNFLTNAIKFTMTGTITIKLETDALYHIFSVTDTGRGIKDADRENIFQPFKQINAEDSSRYGGIGLGLCLCKKISHRMGGVIGFKSVFGDGSTFWVKFPKNIMIPINDMRVINVNDSH